MEGETEARWSPAGVGSPQKLGATDNGLSLRVSGGSKALMRSEEQHV